MSQATLDDFNLSWGRLFDRPARQPETFRRRVRQFSANYREKTRGAPDPHYL